MEDRDLLRTLNDLATRPATRDDWRDLHETIEAYTRRCLARAIAASPQRDDLIAAIGQKAGVT